MRIRQGADHNSLEVRSGTATVLNLVFGLGFAALGFLFAASVGGTIFFAQRSAGIGWGPWWVLLVPVVFLVVGVSVAGHGQRIETVLHRQGPSRTETRQWFGLKRDETTFDVVHGHHLALHTDERIRRTRNGSSRYRISVLAVVLRDGTEVVVGKQQRRGLGGSQPLLEQAGELSHFLGIPLERTGYGAPLGYDLPPWGVSESTGSPFRGTHRSGEPPHGGGGIPDWIRGKGN